MVFVAALTEDRGSTNLDALPSSQMDMRQRVQETCKILKNHCTSGWFKVESNQFIGYILVFHPNVFICLKRMNIYRRPTNHIFFFVKICCSTIWLMSTSKVRFSRIPGFIFYMHFRGCVNMFP